MISRLRHRHLARPDVWAALFLLLVAAIPFWPFFLQAKAFLPTDILYTLPPWNQEQPITDVHNSLLSDPIRVYYPWLTFAHDAVQGGLVPLWNPFIFSGVPHLANNLTATFYPLAGMVYVLPVWLAYTLQGFIHVFLAGLFMHFYLRKIGVSTTGALLGAFAFMFNGFFVGWLEFGVFLNVGIWLPLVFLLMEYVVERKTTAMAMLCAVAIAIPLYGGHVQVAYYLILAAIAYWLFRVGLGLIAQVGQERWRWALRLTYLSSVIWGGALLLFAAQLLPTWELSRLIGRQRESIDGLLASGIPPAQFITLLMPDFLGNPVDGIWWGRHNYSETSMYLGVWPLLLASGALLFRRNKYVWFFGGLALFSILMATAFSPLAWPALHFVPGLDRLRAPGRIIYLADVALPVLAAYGFDALVGRERKMEALAKVMRFAYPAAAVVVAGAALGYVVTHLPVPAYDTVIKSGSGQVFSEGMTYGDFLRYEWDQLGRFALIFVGGVALLAVLHKRLIPATLVAASLLVITGADLTYNADKYMTFTDPALLDRRPAAVTTLQRDAELFRIARYEGSLFLTLIPNYPSVYGLYDTQGSSSYVLKSYLEFLGLTRPQSVTANDAVNIRGLPALKSKLINLMNVKYVIASVPIDDPQFTAVPTEGLLLYQNRDWLQRAFIVFQRKVAPLTETLDRLKDPGFDPAQVVLLEKDGPAYGREGAGAPLQVVITSYKANSVSVTATLPQEGYLVLSDAYYPGWNAYVDGEKGEVLKADYTFRAVHLRPGTHLVEFRYEPGSFRMGAWISGGTALAMLLMVAGQQLFRLVRRHRRGD